VTSRVIRNYSDFFPATNNNLRMRDMQTYTAIVSCMHPCIFFYFYLFIYLKYLLISENRQKYTTVKYGATFEPPNMDTNRLL